jgi:chromosome segregation ATPase
MKALIALLFVGLAAFGGYAFTQYLGMSKEIGGVRAEAEAAVRAAQVAKEEIADLKKEAEKKDAKLKEAAEVKKELGEVRRMAAEEASKVKSAEQEAEAIKSKVEDSQKMIAEAEELRKKLEESEGKVAELQTQLDAAKEQMKAAQAEITQLKARPPLGGAMQRR